MSARMDMAERIEWADSLDTSDGCVRVVWYASPIARKCLRVDYPVDAESCAGFCGARDMALDFERSHVRLDCAAVDSK